MVSSKAIDRKWAFDNLTAQANGHYVICEVLRLIYDELYDLPDEKKKIRLMDLILDVFIMSRKISDRLLYYRAEYKDRSGSRGRHLRRVTYSSFKKREMRKERSINDKNYSLLHK